MRIAICVLTYKRPDSLARLIAGLDELTFRDRPPEVSVVVVDNDAAGSAGQTCRRLAAMLRWPLEYVIEPRRGIPAARNTALDSAGDAEWICFIDDDEVPEPTWLDELLRVQREYDADVVAGPVVSRFDKPIPAWVRKGRFFERPTYANGHRLQHANTGNVMLRSAIRDAGLRFDERLQLTGGSDRQLFRRVARAGYKIVWATDAVVAEWVPKSRVTARWILQRAFRYGVMTPRIDRDLNPGLLTSVRLPAIGCYRILKGTFFLPLTWPFGRHHCVTYLRHICYGAGILAGCFGLRYHEYRQTHGS